MDQLLQFLKDLFLMKYVPDLGQQAGLGVLFVVGLLTSFHCVAMCGGIVLSQTVQKKPEGEEPVPVSKKSSLVPSALYNLGRVIAYTFVGGLVGGLGQVITLPGVWKGILPIVGGVFMIIMGINLLGIFPFLRRFNLHMPAFLARRIKSSANRGPFIVGLLTGLMPCGPLQIVQLYALGTGSIAAGALSMFAFSLGTVPLMFGLGAANSLMTKKFALRVLKVSAVLVILLGMVMVGRGLALSGFIPGFSIFAQTEVPADAGIAVIKGDIQEVTTSILPDSYPPIVVQKGIPVRWTILATKENLNNCNEAIMIASLGIEKSFVVGENIVEFTPEKSGEITYSCWMAMIFSKIIVVDDIKNINISKK